MKKRVYAITENGVEIMRGYAKDIEEKYGIKATMLSTYVMQDRLAKGKYRIKCLGEDSEIKSKDKVFDERINYLIRHIEQNGNVLCTEEPSEYLIVLKEKGYECSVTSYKVKEVADALVERKHRGRTKTDYVITWLNYGGTK